MMTQMKDASNDGKDWAKVTMPTTALSDDFILDAILLSGEGEGRRPGLLQLELDRWRR